MKFYGKAENVASQILESFKAGTIPAALSQVFLTGPDTPCNRYSWSNRLSIILSGHSDARGFRQWQEVGRYVRKGAKACHILVPLLRVVGEEVDDETGEPVKKKVLYGFKSAPLFGYSDTDGEPLPGYAEQERVIDGLPLLEVAQAWGLDVVTYSGRPAQALGYYAYGMDGGRRIALGVENVVVWAHELCHAADHKCLGDKFINADKGKKEVVAQFGAAVLLCLLGREADADLGMTWKYLQSWAGDGKEATINTCLSLINRVCNAVNCILEAAGMNPTPPDGTDEPKPKKKPAKKTECRPAEREVVRYTAIPKAWDGMELYDWGEKGLRTKNGIELPAPSGRKRKTFDRGWLVEQRLGQLFVGDDTALLRECRKFTTETWPVYKKSGRFWQKRTYLVPQKAIEQAKASLAERSKAEQETKEAASL